MVQRVVYRRRKSFRTASNTVRKVRTAAGRAGRLQRATAAAAAPPFFFPALCAGGLSSALQARADGR